MKLKAVPIFGAALLLFLAACGGAPPVGAASTSTPEPDAGLPPESPHVSPYVDVSVESVEVRTLETTPVQVEITIRGTLPDQCQYGFYSVENRRDMQVKVSLSGIHPADTSCAQTIQTVEHVLLLGKDLPDSERGFAPGEYQLIVNTYQVEFSIK